MALSASRLLHELVAQIQALALVEYSVLVAKVIEITGISRSRIFALKKTAREREYNLSVLKVLKENYVRNKTRPGCPKQATEK